jgi:hypothetical protein
MSDDTATPSTRKHHFLMDALPELAVRAAADKVNTPDTNEPF